MKIWRITALLVPFVVLMGCTTTASFNASYETQIPAYSSKLEGKALVLTTVADDAEVLAQRPSSFTGGATTLNIQIGDIVRKMAQSAFSRAFANGADVANNAENSGAYSVVVTPKIRSLDYKYNQAINVGFAITPQSEVTIHVKVIGRDGSVVLDRPFSSGMVSAQSYMMTGSPGEQANRAIHLAVSKVLSDAANETYKALSGK